MDKLEGGRHPLDPAYTVDEQFSYLLSAFVGACYSVIAYLTGGQKL